MWNNVVNAWWSIVFYPATDAPRFRKGAIAMICACVATLAITWVVYILERREWRRHSVVKATFKTSGSGAREAYTEKERESVAKD
jgi:ACS family pantothenate transporter-like MFS transporter